MKIVDPILIISLLFPLMHCHTEKEEKSITQRLPELADQVRAEFLHAWHGYKQYAWGHDWLKPLSKSYRDWHGVSLYITPVDAFDTMKLMGLNAEAEEARTLILQNLNFDHDILVQNFEINIRLLGGLLSAYQGDGDQRFLDLATDLGNRLLPVFNSPTGMPYVNVNLKTGKTSGHVNDPAEIGTLIVEFGTLSRLTGNPVYFDKAKRALVALFERRSPIDLVGTTIDIETGQWVNKTCHVSGMIDSYFEYLLKGALLFNDDDLKRMWETHIAAINKYLADDSDAGLWYGHVDMDTGERVATRFGALDAFFPAVLTLAGDAERAARLQQSCFAMWTLHGIEPEQMDYRTKEVLDPSYVLRPENIESAYYLYRATGDEAYLRMGETYLTSLIAHCRTEAGYAALKSVITKEQDDNMESFFLSETLKYLYLLFAPAETLDFNSVIFTTEAHPLQRPKTR
ncbi:MAG: glycoside hydrolase family 47 protein [Candidatus Zhuqueibacterota bacterium]